MKKNLRKILKRNIIETIGLNRPFMDVPEVAEEIVRSIVSLVNQLTEHPNSISETEDTHDIIFKKFTIKTDELNSFTEELERLSKKYSRDNEYVSTFTIKINRQE